MRAQPRAVPSDRSPSGSPRLLGSATAGRQTRYGARPRNCSPCTPWLRAARMPQRSRSPRRTLHTQDRGWAPLRVPAPQRTIGPSAALKGVIRCQRSSGCPLPLPAGHVPAAFAWVPVPDRAAGRPACPQPSACPALMRADRRADSCFAIQPANATRMSWASLEPFSHDSRTLTSVQSRSRSWRMNRRAPSAPSRVIRSSAQTTSTENSPRCAASSTRWTVARHSPASLRRSTRSRQGRTAG